MEFKQTLLKRKSTRKYEDRQVKDEEIRYVLDGAQLAPVGRGDFDTIQITVVQNEDFFEEIRALEGKSGNKNSSPLYGAPTIIFVSSNRPEDSISIADVACVVENMHLAATDIGLGSVYLWGFIQRHRDKEAFKKLNLPESFLPMSALALGYPTEEILPKETVENKISVNYVKG